MLAMAYTQAMAMEPTRFDTLGLGISVVDGEAVVLLSTGVEDSPIVVTVGPDAAVRIGMTIVALAADAKVLQSQIEHMTQEDLEEYLNEARRRNNYGLN